MSLEIPSAFEARALTKQAWHRVLKQKKENKHNKMRDKHYTYIFQQAHKAASSLGELKLTIKNNQGITDYCKENVDLLTLEGFEIMMTNLNKVAVLSWVNASQGDALELRELANELLDSREFKNIDKQTKRMSLSGQTSLTFTPAYREYQFCLDNPKFIEARGFSIDTSKEKRILLEWVAAEHGEGLKCLELAKVYHAKNISSTIKDAINRAQNSCEYKPLPIAVVRQWFGSQFNTLAYTLQEPHLIRWR